jgi:hypothetical protein
MEYVKQLSDQVDRTQYPAINKGFLAFYRNYAGDEPSANFFAGLYNVALESARASAGTGSVIPQERVDQELERLSGAYNKGQIDSVLNVVRNEIMMRRREITKGTPGAVREKKPAAKPEKPETINLNQFWRK